MQQPPNDKTIELVEAVKAYRLAKKNRVKFNLTEKVASFQTDKDQDQDDDESDKEQDKPEQGASEDLVTVKKVKPTAVKKPKRQVGFAERVQIIPQGSPVSSSAADTSDDERVGHERVGHEPHERVVKITQAPQTTQTEHTMLRHGSSMRSNEATRADIDSIRKKTGNQAVEPEDSSSSSSAAILRNSPSVRQRLVALRALWTPKLANVIHLRVDMDESKAVQYAKCLLFHVQRLSRGHMDEFVARLTSLERALNRMTPAVALAFVNRHGRSLATSTPLDLDQFRLVAWHSKYVKRVAANPDILKTGNQPLPAPKLQALADRAVGKLDKEILKRTASAYCRKCKTDQYVMSRREQRRRADEGMDVFHNCLKCGADWKG